MSALYFGGLDDTVANDTRLYTFTGPSLGSADWCVGAWFRTNALIGSDDQPFFGMGTGNTSNVFVLTVGELSSGHQWGSYCIDSSGTPITCWNLTQGAALPADGSDYLAVMQRRGTIGEIWFCKKGQSASAPWQSSTFSAAATFSGTNWKVGYGGNYAHCIRNPLGEFFLLTGSTLTTANITTLAAGVQITAVNPSPSWFLPLRSGAINETNLGTAGGTATVAGSNWDTTREFFPLGSRSSWNRA